MIQLRKIFKTKEVRNSLLFILAMLLLYRLIAHIPVPGINPLALTSAFEGNEFLGLLNIFSGGTLDNFSLAALGVAPYITSSIIFQLLGMIIPQLEEMQKEEQGRQKINQWTRWMTLPLAALQAYGLIILFGSQAQSALFSETGPFIVFLAILGMSAGTMFLTWIGELISEKNIGNGISLMILASILAGLPTFLSQNFAIVDRSQIITIILFVLAALVTIVSIVIMNEAQRNVPVQYARQVRGVHNRGAVTSHIPLRLNMGGVIPIIFAVSIILFPTVLAQFFLNARSEFLRNTAQYILELFQNGLFYGILYFVSVFVFAYFYTAVVFHPDEVAENLQKGGSFIPGIRPGKQTADYLQYVSNRILLIGATFLSLIAVLPLIVQQFTGSANLIIGGTSILIVVAVAIDAVKQIEAQLSLHEYDA